MKKKKKRERDFVFIIFSWLLNFSFFIFSHILHFDCENLSLPQEVTWLPFKNMFLSSFCKLCVTRSSVLLHQGTQAQFCSFLSAQPHPPQDFSLYTSAGWSEQTSLTRVKAHSHSKLFNIWVDNKPGDIDNVTKPLKIRLHKYLCFVFSFVFHDFLKPCNREYFNMATCSLGLISLMDSFD